jgi:hypothetical protein
MRTVSRRWTALFVITAVSLLAASAAAAEPETVSIGYFTKTGQLIDLAQQKLTELPKEKRTPFVLLMHGMSETPFVCYEDPDGGIVGFLGKEVQVVFADGNSLEDLKKVPAEKWTEAFAQFKPITKKEAKKLREGDPQKPRPRNPVALSETALLLPVVGRPSNFAACKCKDKIYLVEIIEQAKDAASVTLKIHPL